MKWFVQRMLRAEDLEPEPEPLARGGLAHAVLKDTLEGLRERTGSARLTPARLGLARELLREALGARATEFPLSAAPERRPGLSRRLEADLERYLEHAAECESPLEPTYLELGFGFGEEPSQEGGAPSQGAGLSEAAGPREGGRLPEGGAVCRRSTSVQGCGCAGGSTASMSSPGEGRRLSTTTRAATSRRPRSGWRGRMCRSRST